MRTEAYLFFIFLFLNFIRPVDISGQTEFSETNSVAILKILSADIGPRTMGSPEEQKALIFAVEKFHEYGCDTSYLMPVDRFSGGNTSSGVAVGIKLGHTGRMILIGGHIDSSDPEVQGANDDASGSSVAIEAARLFCKRRMNSTMVFCCFGGEEKGLVGSKHFVNTFKEIDSVDLMLQADMANGLGILDIDPDAHGGIKAPKWLVKSAVEEFRDLGYSDLRYPTHFFSLDYALEDGPGSDHEVFLRKGIPAIAFISDVNQPIHTPQDNFQNFDTRGLKRTGDIIVRLAEKYDSGIPGRGTDDYWLYLAGSIPVMIPIWGLWCYMLVSVIISIVGLVKLRARSVPDNIRWSGLKIFLFTLPPVALAWLSANLVGLLKGSRYPWFGNLDHYYLLATLTFAIGYITVQKLTDKFRISSSPYSHFKRSAILLFLFLILTGLLNLKLTVEPATALLLLSLASIIRQPGVRTILLLASPLPMMRIIFSEWSGILFRESVELSIPGAILPVAVNICIIIFFSVYILPVIFGFASVLYDTASLRKIIARLIGWKAFAMILIIAGGYILYLTFQPVYSDIWRKGVLVEQSYDIDSHEKSITITGMDYLNGVTVRRGNRDSLICGNIMSISAEPSGQFDTTWLEITRDIRNTDQGDTSFFDADLNIRSKHRPFTVSVSYSINGGELRAFDTPYQFRTTSGVKAIEFYSFPDSVLTIPVKFSFIGNDTVKERIELLYSKLASPAELFGDFIYTIPRTKYISEHLYAR